MEKHRKTHSLRNIHKCALRHTACTLVRGQTTAHPMYRVEGTQNCILVVDVFSGVPATMWTAIIAWPYVGVSDYMSGDEGQRKHLYAMWQNALEYLRKNCGMIGDIR